MRIIDPFYRLRAFRIASRGVSKHLPLSYCECYVYLRLVIGRRSSTILTSQNEGIEL